MSTGGTSTLFFGLTLLCSLVHFTRTDAATVNLGSTTKHVTTRTTASNHHPTTQRPTPEHNEQTSTSYHYDRITHYICGYHSSRRAHFCLCYHVPYEHRVDMHLPMKLLETEKHMLDLYTVGNHVLMDDLEFYSRYNYDRCHGYGRRPNVTIYLVYDNNNHEHIQNVKL